MHPYATDTWERERIIIGLAFLSIGLGWLLHEILIRLSIDILWWIEIPSVMGFYGILMGLFDRYLWKLQPLRKLGIVHIPFFAGEWEGELSSSFDEYRTKVPLTILIQQTWFRMSITLSTNQSRSSSNSASLTLENPAGPTLSYQYLNEPMGSSDPRLSIHRGTAVLVLTEDGLEGDYYTGRDRENHGSIVVKRKSLRQG